MSFRSSVILSLAAICIVFSSCSAEKRLKRRITGTWTIASYQEQNVTGESGSSANIGTLEFLRNGDGRKKISGIPWRKNFTEGADFRWQNSSNTITIFDQNSIFAKSWIITVNKRSRQQWRSTDRGNVQTLELTR